MELQETPYDSFFREQEEKYQIPGLANIIKSMAFTESSFDPKAVGQLGEKGMLQFMEETAKQYGVQDPFDPQQAITGAARKFSDDYNFYKEKGYNDLQSRNLAIEAYNGGRGNAGKSPQTADYLNKVLGNLPKTSISQDQLDFLNSYESIEAPSVRERYTPPVAQENTIEQKLEFINSLIEKEQQKTPVESKVKIPEVDSTSAVIDNIGKSSIPIKDISVQDEKDLLKDENFKVALDYLVARFGKDNLDFTEDTTKQDVIDKYLSTMRSVEWNTSLGGAPELLFINNIQDRDVLTKIAKGHELYDQLPDIFDEFKNKEYAEGLKKLGLGFGNLALDPTSYIGLGIGSFVKFKLAREGIKTLLKQKIRDFKAEKGIPSTEKISTKDIRKLKRQVERQLGKKTIGATAGFGAEAAVGAGHSIIDQRIDLDLKTQQFKFDLQRRLQTGDVTTQEAQEEIKQFKKDNKIDTDLVVLNSMLGGLLGAAGVVGTVYGIQVPKIGSKEVYQNTLKELATTPAGMLPKELDDLTKELGAFLEKEYSGGTIDFGTIDFSKIEELRGLKGQAKIDKYKELKAEGKLTLEKLQEAGVLTAPQIQNDMAIRSMQAAFRILISNDYFNKEVNQILTKEKRIGEVLTDILSAADQKKFDEVVLQNALSEAGIGLDEFSYAIKYSVQDAGRKLKGLQQLASNVRKASNLDPDLKKLLDQHFAETVFNETLVSPFVKVHDFIKRIEREAKALVVSSVATTVRNVYGTTIGLTLDSATRVLDSALYGAMKAIDGQATGKYKPTNPYLKRESLGSTEAFTKTIESSFGTLGQLLVNTRFSLSPTELLASSQTKIADQFELILEDNPYIRNLLLTSLQETGEQSLSAISRFANTFNIAQDAFFRRAVFVQSIKRQTMRAGVDFEQLLANNKKIPTNIIQKAADEALESTFGKMPKGLEGESIREAFQKRGYNSIETMGSQMGRMFVDFFEKIMPFGSLIVPFPRFMANAMAFQYKYSVFQFGKAGAKFFEIRDITKKAKKKLTEELEFNKDLNNKLKEGIITKEQHGRDFIRRANPKYEEDLFRQLDIKRDIAMQDLSLAISRGAIGTSLLLYAINYRKENQDTEWFNVKSEAEGEVDVRNIFPIAPFLALGDAVAKYHYLDKKEEIDMRQVMEALAGIKLSPAPVFPVLENVFASLGDADTAKPEKLMQVLGELFGDFGSRFVQPGQPLFAFLDLFDAEYGIARDPKATDATHGMSLLGETTLNRIINRTTPALVPGKGELEKAVDIFSPKAPVRGTEFFSVLTGFRVMPRVVNKVEKEFKVHNINPYTFFGSSGDRKYDRELIKNSHKYVIGDQDTIGILQNLVTPGSSANQEYESMNFVNKKRTLMKTMAEAMRLARKDTADMFSETEATRFFKLQFNRLPSIDRRALKAAYRERTGADIDETQDWKTIMLQDFNDLEVSAINSGKYDSGFSFDRPVVKDVGFGD